MNFTPTPQQEDIFDDLQNGTGHTFVAARAGTGKCLGYGTPVLRFDGKVVPVEEVREGDLLMGPDSEPRYVLSTSQGRGPLYQVVPVKGDPWVCNDAHVLTLTGTNHSMGLIRDVSVATLIEETLPDRRIDRSWKLFRTGVEFPSKPLPVEPYLVGLWLGDGTRGESIITNCEPEIVDYCKEVASRYGYEVLFRWEEKNNTFNIRFRLGPRGEAGRNTPSLLRRFFKSCETNDGFKRVPDEYIVNDTSARMQLLAGLLDTDGYFTGGGYEWVTVSKPLCEQMLYLCRSLGLAAYNSIKPVNGKDYYRVSISGELSSIPVRVPRRQAPPRAQVKRVTCTGFDLEPIGEGPYYGFTLDRDGRFLLGDFTVTHNTSTIVHGLSYLPARERKDTLLVAFNREIKNVLLEKAPRDVEVSTLHAFGKRAIEGTLTARRVSLDDDKMRRIAVELSGDRETRLAIVKTASMAKNLLLKTDAEIEAALDELDFMPAPGTLRPGTPLKRMTKPKETFLQGKECWGEDPEEELAELINDPEASDTYVKGRRLELVSLVQQALKKAAEMQDVIDYDDMIWFPNIFDLVHSRYQRVFVDEYQDLNPAQSRIIFKTYSKQGGRACGLGDEFQSIYQWRGADAEVIAKFVKRTKAKVFPLTVSFRCAQRIAKLARKIVPDFEAAPGNPDGHVEEVDLAFFKQNVREGDFVLSRVNAPMASLCLELVKSGRKATIAGKDLGGRLLALVDKSKKDDLGDFTKWVLAYRDKTIQRHKEQDRDPAPIVDLISCLLFLANDVGSIGDLRWRISRLFSETEDNEKHAEDLVVFSSVHKAKGLERDRVWLLRDTFMKSRPARRDAATGEVLEWAEPSQEECNIYYVALTRAREELYMVRGLEK